MTAVLGTRVYQPEVHPRRTRRRLVHGRASCSPASSRSRSQGRTADALVPLIGCTSILFYTKEQLGRIRLSLPIVGLMTWTDDVDVLEHGAVAHPAALQYYARRRPAMICVVSVMSARTDHRRAAAGDLRHDRADLRLARDRSRDDDGRLQRLPQHPRLVLPQELDGAVHGDGDRPHRRPGEAPDASGSGWSSSASR